MKWIPISEQHPTNYNEVLLGNLDNEVAEGFYDGTKYVAYRADFDATSVTHFMSFDDIPTVPIE